MPGAILYRILASRQQLVDGWDELYADPVIAMGRAFSPIPDGPPFYADLPFVPGDQGIETDEPVPRLWERNAPLHMLDGCRKFSAELELRPVSSSYGQIWHRRANYSTGAPFLA